ncbi:PAS domain-containing sensor histidine kinase [Pedobacter aquatilis]|uniref:PAS domain-containing sensor histidine kinase n=1 Tax=Pedobacter aquatilis TaxID=351343 RepID=UPI0025B5E9FC|nr:PAS domain-containing sensor histidine kinase [Pedobacter aquatilis]MDN3587546.1 PAS domain-containing sensor histidine kinase [Pedobacter aquatilis]
MIQINSQQIFCQMGDVSPDGYFIYNISKSSVEYANPASYKIFGVEPTELENYADLLIKKVHPEDLHHLLSCYDELIVDGGAKKYMFKFNFNQEEKYLRYSLVRSEDGIYIYGTIEDFTVDQENKIHIEQINARKNVTLEVLAHDLKEPMGMIRMTASSLENNLDRLGKNDLENSLRFINDMCERNLKLVRSIVNQEFLKSSVVAIKKDRADLVWELKDVVRFYNRSHLKDVRKFTFSSTQDKIFLFLDSMKFLQVINNLISNSIKFTSEGGKIAVFAEERDDDVLVSVSDNGIGIPSSMRSQLFYSNKEVLRRGLNGEESGGLGMSIIKDIVDLHGGKIWFVSEEDVGTTFFISLPKN